MCQIRLTNKPKQAHRYAKSGSRLCQIRLKYKPNQANMPYKYAKPGTQIYEIRRPVRGPLERKIQLSFPLQSRTRASDTPTTRRSKLGVKMRKLSSFIIGCETVKIRAMTPFGFNDSKHRGISWRIILVNETAQKDQPSR